MLAEADLVKFAFVTRKDMNDNRKHAVLATHSVQTASWAQQMNISMDRHWCIIKYLVNEIEAASNEARLKKEAAQAEKKEPTPEGEDEEEEGDEHEFILLKDFNTMSIRLYRKDEDDLDEEDELGLGEKEQIPA